MDLDVLLIISAILFMIMFFIALFISKRKIDAELEKNRMQANAAIEHMKYGHTIEYHTDSVTENTTENA